MQEVVYRNTNRMVDVAFDVTGTADVLHQIHAIGFQRPIDAVQHGKRPRLIMNRIEGRHEVVGRHRCNLVEVRHIVGDEINVLQLGNAEVRDFWQAVSKLSDPIDAAFVREFQQSTLAQPVPPAFFDAVVHESLKVPARVWKAALEPFLELDFSLEIVSIRVPTLIVWGDRDAFVPRREQDMLAAEIAGSRLEIYSGAGHSPQWEEPERFAAQLSGFINELRIH